MSARHMTNDVIRGAVGAGATTAGALVSLLPQIEAGLRIASLLVGITVGVLTAVSIWRRMKR